MSKTFKKQTTWNNRNPHAEDARLRKAGAMADRRMRRSHDAGRNWRHEMDEELELYEEQVQGVGGAVDDE